MKTTLITGASSGIGYELSKLFAQDGYNLVLVARNEQRLQQLAGELTAKFDVWVKVMAKDLAIACSPAEIFAELEAESIQLDILVNNAGFQVYGPFLENDLAKELQMLQVNLLSLTQLTKLFLPGMIARGNGKILNVGSTGSFVPGPLNAVYCASKAYVLSLSEAMAEELAGTGVTVTALCPGATITEFHKRAQMEDVRLFKMGAMEAGPVAAAGYRALMAGRRIVVPGFQNRLLVLATRFLPRKLVTRIGKVVMSRL
ncbi:MAG: SDR family oxidoreductase [Chloroflexota bacterium]